MISGGDAFVLETRGIMRRATTTTSTATKIAYHHGYDSVISKQRTFAVGETRIRDRGIASSFLSLGAVSSPAAAAAGIASPISTSVSASVLAAADEMMEAFEVCKSDISKTCKVKIGVSEETGRLGLIATERLKMGESALALPYDDRILMTPKEARKTVFKDVLTGDYDGWTGDFGLVALLILNEVARAAASNNNKHEFLPKRPKSFDVLMKAWVKALPSLSEMSTEENGGMGLHPLFWSEDDQESLQMSSTKKIYRTLDDIEEDASWLTEQVFEKDRERFPATVTLDGDGEVRQCYTEEGFRWALGLAQSRSFFIDGSLRLIPFLDFVNHADDGNEVAGGYMGTFGTTAGAKLLVSRKYKPGDEVFCSYGPKSAADYLLEHGFCPRSSFSTSVSELVFEVDPDDRFYDDKLDILQYETYDQAPMDPMQSFDVVSSPDQDGEPDPALLQFIRLLTLDGADAFLLEAIFRKDVWGFMSMPVSEANELNTVDTIIESCRKALDGLEENVDEQQEEEAAVSKQQMICRQVQKSERRALSRTMDFLLGDKEALDLKEYYQQRRLKEMGLDSEWSKEDGIIDPDASLGYGQTRLPGGADFDW